MILIVVAMRWFALFPMFTYDHSVIAQQGLTSSRTKCEIPLSLKATQHHGRNARQYLAAASLYKSRKTIIPAPVFPNAFVQNLWKPNPDLPGLISRPTVAATANYCRQPLLIAAHKPDRETQRSLEAKGWVDPRRRRGGK